MRTPWGVLAGVVAGALLAGGHGAGAAPPRTVTVTLVAGLGPANGTLNFNGYARGELTLTVPRGWRVTLHYRNRSALRHSLVVIPATAAQPEAAPATPAFPGAATTDPLGGIGPGREETVSFVAERAGRYEFLCGVLGHAQAGMWDTLVVSPSAGAPRVHPAGALQVVAQ